MAESKQTLGKRKMSACPASELSITNEAAEGGKYIGTHSGTFHCDESLACGMLKLLPQFSEHGIVRSRNPEVLAKCEIVVDVGAEYDPERLRFDHHQRSFDGTLEGYATKLSSAGLVYKHFGREVIQAISADPLPEATLELMYHKTYRAFIEAVDGNDNGINSRTGELNYKVGTHLSARVGGLNLDWNEEQTAEKENDRFAAAVQLATGELVANVQRRLTVWLPARSIVEAALSARRGEAVHPSGQIAVLPQFCPWKEHLFDVEKERAADGSDTTPVLYMLYQDTRGGWRVQAVPEAPSSFQSRKALPAAWRGMRNEELDALTGFPGGVFVHAAGFIGGHKTYEGALAMATAALSLE